MLRTHNVYANWAAPSRDITTTFAIQEQLRFICAGGLLSDADRLVLLGRSSELHSDLINITSIQKHDDYVISA